LPGQAAVDFETLASGSERPEAKFRIPYSDFRIPHSDFRILNIPTSDSEFQFSLLFTNPGFGVIFVSIRPAGVVHFKPEYRTYSQRQ
jgi:hypothetical protein